MSDNGASSTAVVAIVIIVLAALVFFFFMFRGAGGESDAEIQIDLPDSSQLHEAKADGLHSTRGAELVAQAPPSPSPQITTPTS